VGFYIRKAFSFGPVRLNLSRSGLGASFGVKGARIGVGPRGTYIHAGRAGFYYRQTLISPGPSHEAIQPVQPPQTSTATGLQQVSSSAAVAIADSSPDRLLQELNRVTKRTDVFGAAIAVGAVLLIRAILAPVDSWIFGAFVISVALVATLARHCDVTNGTLLLRYSLSPESSDKFTQLQSAFNRFAACHRIWHVDASGRTYDWKRNAGVQTLTERSVATATLSIPPRVDCNIGVPTLGANGTTLYFFPDRLLVRDGSGFGAVTYHDLHSGAGPVRFVESDPVPRDGVMVDTTWQYVAKHGGPDRRFTNNRQLPVMSYGNFVLGSDSGLKQLFQCSVPDTAVELCKAIGAMGQRSDTESVDVSFATPKEKDSSVQSTSLWLAILVMVVAIIVLPIPPEWRDATAKPAAQPIQKSPELERLETNLYSYLRTKKFQSAVVSASGTRLTLIIADQNQKHARQCGLNPLNKDLLLAKVLPPNSEFDLCRAGIRTVGVVMNERSPGEITLNCTAPRERRSRGTSDTAKRTAVTVPPAASHD